jgi:hypothetical protein
MMVASPLAVGFRLRCMRLMQVRTSDAIAYCRWFSTTVHVTDASTDKRCHRFLPLVLSTVASTDKRCHHFYCRLDSNMSIFYQVSSSLSKITAQTYQPPWVIIAPPRVFWVTKPHINQPIFLFPSSSTPCRLQHERNPASKPSLPGHPATRRRAGQFLPMRLPNSMT